MQFVTVKCYHIGREDVSFRKSWREVGRVGGKLKEGDLESRAASADTITITISGEILPVPATDRKMRTHPKVL